MKKRIFALVALVLVLSCMLVACGGGSSKMVMGTGSNTGTYYAFGGVLGTDIGLEAEPGPGFPRKDIGKDKEKAGS